MGARRFPIVSTIVVALAVAAMVALGVWQLQRKGEKEALLARLAANEHLAAIGFPERPFGDELLFRRAHGDCRPPVDLRMEGAGSAGFRVIGGCRGGMTVQLGTTHDPHFRPEWRGGLVTGYVSHAPDHRPLIAAAFDRRAKPLMLVADRPAPGLNTNPPANLADVPNNHLSYAVQWFLFAVVALVIYGVALRRRLSLAAPT